MKVQARARVTVTATATATAIKIFSANCRVHEHDILSKFPISLQLCRVLSKHTIKTRSGNNNTNKSSVSLVALAVDNAKLRASSMESLQLHADLSTRAVLSSQMYEFHARAKASGQQRERDH